jgi:multidrug resistance efflux pump
VVRSLLNLDEEVEQGDLLIEFDTRSEQLELEQSKAIALAQDRSWRHSRSDHPAPARAGGAAPDARRESARAHARGAPARGRARDDGEHGVQQNCIQSRAL